jgi:rubrerythrin
MLMDLKGSKTEKNLKIAFAGESEARNKYTFYASQARKEGYVQIANFFQETADNEKEHAEIWFKLLNGIGTTAENLKDGQKCMLILLKKHVKKDLTKSLTYLKV